MALSIPTTPNEMNQELQLRLQTVNMPFTCGCSGPLSATIAVVGEAPGNHEVALKQPLVGASGKFFFDKVRRYGITRANVYCTNVVKYKLIQDENSRKKKRALPPNEEETWGAVLREELACLPNLKFVVLLGDMALKAVCGEHGITNWRGSVLARRLAHKTIHCLATYNPAFCLREPKTEIIFAMDMGKLNRMVKGEIKTYTFEEHINPTLQEALEYIDLCRHSTEPVSFDIETLGNETSCIGLAHSNVVGMCINFRTQNDNVFSTNDEITLRKAFQAFFHNPGLKLIAQNGGFDAGWLWYKNRIRVPPIWFDTLLAHHTLYPPMPHSLAFLTSQYTDHPYYKDDGKTWGETGDINTFWRYNVKDVCITRDIALQELDELRTAGLEDFFFNHVMRLQPHLVAMEVTGIKCDETTKASLNDTIGRSVEEAKRLWLESARLSAGIADLECNPNSPAALSSLFFKTLKLVGRGASTDEENRKRMRAHPRTSPQCRDMLSKLDTYKKAHKFFTTYVNSTIDDDGRFRCAYKQAGVSKAPGRLSSSQTAWGTGMNLQNQPEAAKVMFVADDGYEFTYFDAAQIEARIVAWKANIVAWKHQFELARLNPGSYDAHCALASDMFKVPYEQVPKFDIYPDDWPIVALRGAKSIRFVAKRCRHGLNYRMAADRLATTSGLPMREAEEAYRIYHRTTPEIQLWWDDTIAEVRDTIKRYGVGRLDNAFGRRWLLLEKFTDEALESVIAFYPQSTAGDHIARAIYLCQDDHHWPRSARVKLNIHDALIAIHKPKDRDCVQSIMRKHGETPIIINGEPLIVPVDFARSEPDEKGVHRWSTLKKIKVQSAKDNNNL